MDSEPRRDSTYRVWSEIVTSEPPYAEVGIPHAAEFYRALDADSPPKRYRETLALCHNAVAEHLDATREALEQMRTVERTPLAQIRFEKQDVEPHLVEMDAFGSQGFVIRRTEAGYEYVPQWNRYSRAIRVFANEGRGALESFVYEAAFAFAAVPQKSGRDQERSIGMNRKTIDALANHASQMRSPNLHALAKHLQRIRDDPAFAELDALRSVGYHRNVPLMRAITEIEADATTMMPPAEAPALRFYRPARFDNPDPDQPHEERCTAYCAVTLAWLMREINEAYRLAALAIQDYSSSA